MVKTYCKKIGAVPAKICKICMTSIVILSCYTFETNPAQDIWEWQGARDQCRMYGMDLPVFGDSDTSEWYNDQLTNLDVFDADSSIEGVWIGLVETEVNSKEFIWVDNVSLADKGYDARFATNFNSKVKEVEKSINKNNYTQYDIFWSTAPKVYIHRTSIMAIYLLRLFEHCFYSQIF